MNARMWMITTQDAMLPETIAEVFQQRNRIYIITGWINTLEVVFIMGSVQDGCVLKVFHKTAKTVVVSLYLQYKGKLAAE